MTKKIVLKDCSGSKQIKVNYLVQKLNMFQSRRYEDIQQNYCQGYVKFIQTILKYD